VSRVPLGFGLALAICFAPGFGLANDDPLYRADERGPDVIFAIGFSGRGTNMNLLHHVSGMSCWNWGDTQVERSAYVSMSSSPREALVYANYVYRIRPDADAPDAIAAFSVLAGLEALARDWERYQLDLRQRAAIAHLLGFAPSDGQYVSQRIPPHWIESVAIYRYDDTGRSVYVRTENNPGFRPPARIGSRATFSGPMIDGVRSHGALPQRVQYAVGQNGTEAAACMDSGTDACGGSQTRLAPRSLRFAPITRWLQCAQAPMPARGNIFERAVDVILSP
jgi:hypothetical protein